MKNFPLIEQGLGIKDLVSKIRENTAQNLFQMSMKEGKVSSNSKSILKVLELLKEGTAEMISTGSLSEITDHQTILKEMQTWVKKCRTEITQPMDSTKSELMEVEKFFNPIMIETKEAIELLKQEEYKKGELNISREFESLILEARLDINIGIFKDFIDVKKKAKTYQELNKKDQLSKSAKDNIREQFDMVANPIREQIAQKEKQDNEYKQFNYNLSKAEDAISIEELRALLPSLYPTIIESAEMALNGKLDIIKAKEIAEQKTSDAENKKEADKEAMATIKLAYIEGMESQSIKDVSFAISEIVKLSEVIATKENTIMISEYLNELRGSKTASCIYTTRTQRRTKRGRYASQRLQDK